MLLLMLWLRREARLRWRALLACGLLVAITSATALTAVVGARRGESAVSRLLAVARPAIIEVVSNPGPLRLEPSAGPAQGRGADHDPTYTTLPTYVAPASTPERSCSRTFEAMRTIEIRVVLAGMLADRPARG